MFPELDKSYAPQAIEPRWAREWVDTGLFQAQPHRDGVEDWSLVIPPPNVTGSLHMGHMLEHTLIDIMVRWQRMRGKNVLWLPGTDHAGIATQMVVERKLAAEGQNRREMGREAFVEAVWAWKKQSGDRIQEQMIRLGASCDWSRQRFTLDDGLSRAVREVFVTLYEQGLIYRGRYIVNWCPRCQTAVSDLEVTHHAVNGKLYQVRYPVAGSPGTYLTVATTRPETILADVAVAVNAADVRYRELIGLQVEVPLAARTVPVIADEIAQPEFGTGAVKITPGHDANDFAAGQRHGLPQLVVLDETGHMNATAGAYAGLDRFAARKRVVADLEAAGLLAGVADHAMALGQCQRCQTVIEPRISTQWFVKIAPLAEAAVGAVERGEIKFTPENNGRIYFEWMANIHDWCISRQLWWGHRVPAWHCAACGEIIVARESPAACACGGTLRQDEDVLDTWFSSGLWPFSTLGWPEPTEDLRTFYPTSLLITGFDILFFWVARMIMLGVHFMGKVPFREVYIHALVRDADKQKMSKTKGNVIDPLVVTEKYGTDAVRFTLAAMAAPGTDIALSEERMQGYAAFANKIWNAARFIFMTLAEIAPNAQAPEPTGDLTPTGSHAVDAWIFWRLNFTAKVVNQALKTYRFDDAANEVYHFVWHEFCDWYLELIKARIGNEDGTSTEGLAPNLLAAFAAMLRLLHPFMPFITEELWHTLHGSEQKSIAFAAYPQGNEGAEGRLQYSSRQIGLLQQIVTTVRSLRPRWQIVNAKIAFPHSGAAAVYRHDFDMIEPLIRRLAGVGEFEQVDGLPAQTVGWASTERFDLQLDTSQLGDLLAAARERLAKERDSLDVRLKNARAKLDSAGFRQGAKPEVVAETERLEVELARQLEQTEASLREF